MFWKSPNGPETLLTCIMHNYKPNWPTLGPLVSTGGLNPPTYIESYFRNCGQWVGQCASDIFRYDAIASQSFASFFETAYFYRVILQKLRALLPRSQLETLLLCLWSAPLSRIRNKALKFKWNQKLRGDEPLLLQPPPCHGLALVTRLMSWDPAMTTPFQDRSPRIMTKIA